MISCNSFACSSLVWECKNPKTYLNGIATLLCTKQREQTEWPRHYSSHRRNILDHLVYQCGCLIQPSNDTNTLTSWLHMLMILPIYDSLKNLVYTMQWAIIKATAITMACALNIKWTLSSILLHGKGILFLLIFLSINKLRTRWWCLEMLGVHVVLHRSVRCLCSQHFHQNYQSNSKQNGCIYEVCVHPSTDSHCSYKTRRKNK